MLGKLMKYEFKSTGRIYLPMFAALLIFSVVSRLFINLDLLWPQVIGIVVSVIMIIAIVVISLMLTLQRFNKNLLSSEGYLMMTLPVSTDSIIWSKLLVASIWFVVSGVIVTLSISIMAVTGEAFAEVSDAIRSFFGSFNANTGNMILYKIETIISFVLSIFSSILMIYACMAVSMLVNRHRGLFAFGAFILFMIIGQVIAGVFVSSGAAGAFLGMIEDMSQKVQGHFTLCSSIFVELIVSAIFYFMTRYMLKNKLNLE